MPAINETIHTFVDKTDKFKTDRISEEANTSANNPVQRAMAIQTNLLRLISFIRNGERNEDMLNT